MDSVASQLATRFAGRESELARAVSELRMRGAGELSLLPASSEEDDIKTVQAALDRVQQRVARARREAEAARAREETSSRVAELVALFLSGENEAELARRVAVGEAQLEGVRAFRMVREKVRAAKKKEEKENDGGEKRVVGVATAVVVASSLGKMRESLTLERTVVWQRGTAVLEAAAEAAKEAAERAENGTERRMVAEGAALVLAERFGREPQIPLYAALHYNSVMALAESARKGEEWGKELEKEAEKRLEAGTERVREEMKRHMAEAEEEGAREEDQGVRLVRAVKRCAHGLGMVRKAWSNVLEPETLQRVLCGDLADWVLEAVTQRLMKQKKNARIEGLAKSGGQCLELMLPVLGLSKEASSETERRSVGGVAWSRARKMVELLEGVDLADLGANLNKLTSCFSKDELRTIVVNLYADDASRAALLNKI